MICSAVRFLADDSGAFTAKLGMLFDATPLLGGPRSKVRSLFYFTKGSFA